MERLGQFEICKAKLLDEVMTTQSDILNTSESKRTSEKIASVTTDIIGMKAVNKKLEKYNDILYETSKYPTKLNENLCHDNS